ncbi:MAG TPA: glycosyltransferase family 4 protein, partial [Pyrinomonadaceae bacterium]|nr:glycosyltransferase family 4 protein [Pyrinomonadaceae bacterium]
DEILIGFVGRLTEIKNIPLLLEAFARLATESPKTRLIIAGDGHLRGELENLAAELGINGRVTILGNRADIAAVYSGLDIVALTSLNEGTPLSLIEAMAAGRPVISTFVGGVRDLLGPLMADENLFQIYERGIGVRSGDAAGIAAGLRYLMENTDVRNSIAARGREYVHKNYSKNRLIDDIKNLYREIDNE